MDTSNAEPRAKNRRRRAPAIAEAAAKPASQHIVDEVIALSGQGVDALRIAWVRRFHRPAPPIQSADTLRRLYAWALQCDIFGDVDAETAKLIGRARASVKNGKSPGKPAGPQLRAGMILVREWRGAMHRVLVLDHGFEHAGRRHRTLTEVARSITGTRWSGPRFFGLSSDASRPRRSTSAQRQARNDIRCDSLRHLHA